MQHILVGFWWYFVCIAFLIFVCFRTIMIPNVMKTLFFDFGASNESTPTFFKDHFLFPIVLYIVYPCSIFELQVVILSLPDNYVPLGMVHGTMSLQTFSHWGHTSQNMMDVRDVDDGQLFCKTLERDMIMETATLCGCYVSWITSMQVMQTVLFIPIVSNHNITFSACDLMI